MKRLLLVLVAVIVLAGCAGMPTKYSTCVKNALNTHWVEREDIERLHAEPRVTESCERVEGAVFDGVSLNPNLAFFKCDVADAIEDWEHSTLLDMNTLRMRSQLRSCLRR